MTKVHTYSAEEAGLLVNAYLVETDRGVVAVDGTLTVSDSRALQSRINSLGKPLSTRRNLIMNDELHVSVGLQGSMPRSTFGGRLSTRPTVYFLQKPDKDRRQARG